MKLLQTVKCDCCNGTGRRQSVIPGALRALRKQKEMTLENIAAIAGCSFGYVRDVELGLKRCTEKILKIYQSL